MKTVVRLLFLLLAFTGYFFVAMFIMAYYYSESHYRLDAAYKQNSMLKPYLKGAEDTISFGIVSDPKGGRYDLLYCSPFLMAPRILGAKLKFFDKKAWFDRGSIWGRLGGNLAL